MADNPNIGNVPDTGLGLLSFGEERGEGDGEEIWVELPKIQDKRADVPATFD